MTTLTVRFVKDHFVVTGPDIEPMRFKSRPEGQGLVHGASSRLASNGDRPQGRAPSKSQGMTLSPHDAAGEGGA